MLYLVVGTKFGKVQSKNYNLKSWICSANLNLRNRIPPVSDSLQMWRKCEFSQHNLEQNQPESMGRWRCAVQEQDEWHHSRVSWGTGGAVSNKKCWESGMALWCLNLLWFRVCLCYISIVSPDKVKWMQIFSRDLLSILCMWVALINVNENCMCSKSEDSLVMPWEVRTNIYMICNYLCKWHNMWCLC